MSALHAMALPENDPDRRAATICRAHGRTLRRRAVRSRAPADWMVHGQVRTGQPLSGQAPANAPARSQGPANAPARSQAADVPLRLTRRGRIVIAAAVSILVAVISLIAAGAVQATSHSLPPRVAEQNLSRVVVRPGQSLWSVAESTDPGADTRLVVQQIIELNGLTGDAVVAGQQLWVPRG